MNTKKDVKKKRYGVKKFAAAFLALAVLLGVLPAVRPEAVQAANNGTAISTAEDLLQMAGSTGAFYLTDDIDMTEYGLWTPISFGGTLDGNGHAISNLKVSGKNGGLFSQIEDATIKDLEIRDIEKKGEVDHVDDNEKDWFMDGALAYAAVDSNISGVSASGEMELYQGWYGGYNAQAIGGLVGRMSGASVMERCANNVNIQYTYQYTYEYNYSSEKFEYYALNLGGLAGAVGSSSKVLNCYNTGIVHSIYSSSIFSEVGTYNHTSGLVGALQGKLYYCYNIGSVIEEGSITEGKTAWLANVYTSGYALNCYGLEGTAEYDYLWDHDDGIEPQGCAKKTESELKMRSTYEGWNFTDIWTIDPAKNNGYPTFVTEQAQKPVANFTSGSYTDPISVTLTSPTPNATIYYTLDGSAPTTKSFGYYNPIRISKTTTLRAIAVADGYKISDVAVYKYKYQIKAPQASLKSGRYQGSIAVTLSCAMSGAKIYYTTNGKTPTVKSTRYKGGKIKIKKTTTLKAIAVKGSAKSKVLTRKYIIKRR